jgi:hypothetical protein
MSRERVEEGLDGTPGARFSALRNTEEKSVERLGIAGKDAARTAFANQSRCASL